MPDDDKITDDALEAALVGKGDSENGDGNEGDTSNDTGHDPADDEESVDDRSDVDGDVGEKSSDGDGDEDGKKEGIDWEKELQKARSDWGRKQSKLESQVESLTANLNQLVDTLKVSQKQTNVDDADFGVDPDEPIPLTMGGLVQSVQKIIEQQQNTQNQYQSEYENSYMKKIESLGSDYSPKVHKHIVERMFKDFNVKHSDNPELDAQLNFRNAEAAILREVRLRKKNPLKGKPPNSALGGPTNTDQDSNAIAPIKLDKYAADFVKSTGMKEEEAQKALQGDMPLYLRGSVR